MYFDSFQTRKKNAYIKKGIESDSDIIRFFPTKYKDYRSVTILNFHDFSNEEKNDIAVVATIKSIENKKSDKKSYAVVKFNECETNTPFFTVLFGIWNGGDYLADYIGKPILVTGKFKKDPTYGYSVANPVFYTEIKENLYIHPIYRKIQGISETTWNEDIEYLLTQEEQDGLPSFIREKHNIPDINEAIQKIHKPQTPNDIELAKARFILDDLIYLNTLLYQSKHDDNTDICFSDVSMATNIVNSLPYSLTQGQKDALNNIFAKASKGKLVDALIQGDVGCGKTIVAMISMILAVSNGYQAVMMAPTFILATQHYNFLKTLVPEEEVCMLHGGLKKREKDNIFKKIYAGEYKYIIGTQSLVSKSNSVPFSNLGIAIIDEEHKFGVEQRAELLSKGIHTIVMSATPIPRTFAMAKYGDMIDIIQIKDKPEGRKEVKTLFSQIDDMDRLMKTINSAIRPDPSTGYKRSQVYVVCPMIEDTDSEVMEGVYSVDNIYSIMKRSPYLQGANIACVTGKTGDEEREQIFKSFEDNTLDVLISTTVIEVGINVPNANLMVIMNAERFGLATMHQLRGRVGRGSVQGFCILVSQSINSRINAMLNTTDGFKIAQLDTEERKIGNFVGTEQSGKNKITEEMFMYPKINEIAKTIVREISEISNGMMNFRDFYQVPI